MRLSTRLSRSALALITLAAFSHTLQADDMEALGRGIHHLRESFGELYPQGAQFQKRLDQLRSEDPQAPDWDERFAKLQREALLANPLLDFDNLMVVRRKNRKDGASGKALGLPQNWQGNCVLPRSGYQNEIAVLSCKNKDSSPQAIFTPGKGEFVGDLDLSYDGRRILFSMPDSSAKEKPWHLWEVGIDGTGLKKLTPTAEQVDQYDGCYLPDGRIIFSSTAGFQGVPCVAGNNNVANLYQLDPVQNKVRQLCYDQDHNWNPVVMNDGRVMYVRWEYTDTAHYFTRILFTMNPDGTGQMAAYGSNSYWPNSFFYPRPIPGEANKIAAIISGHHGAAREGELVLFDLSKGRHEADGAIQKIPGYGKPVEAVITDQLVKNVYPRFLHPYPLSGEHFIVSCQPEEGAPWGIWLVDVFDNMISLFEEPGYALFEPYPLRPRERPNLIPDRVDLASNEAEVFLSDIYAGKAMEGLPHGEVKQLRLFEYHYAYRKMGGHIQVGIDGPWDVRRLLGTVPVEEDGSAFFKIPANTPVAVQPLDSEGRALQIMRSWFTGQPGERMSCTGCHEDPSQAAAPIPTLAAGKPPSHVIPWNTPTRGFDFGNEVQPVLDRHCVKCHDGKADHPSPNLLAKQPLVENGKGKYAGKFDASYLGLHPFVHRPGPESDSRVNRPGEYFAETSELIRMLRKGHHGVRLEPESFERLVTWIDLNVPDHGSWGSQRDIPGDFEQLRLASRQLYANRSEDPELISQVSPLNTPAATPVKVPHPTKIERLPGWPFDPTAAQAMQAELGSSETIKLANKIRLEMIPIPAGRFVMGDAQGAPDELPRAAQIEQPFLLSSCEITNDQFACFDPEHDSGVLSNYNKDATNRGLPMTQARQPVARVSWDQAVAYCEWLSEKTGRRFRLPTEEEWEWACRAGSRSALHFGSLDSNFGSHANLADRQLAKLCRRDSPKWVPRIDSVNDGHTGPAPVGNYTPNAWGLLDMHGNLSEWTSSSFDPSGFLPSSKSEEPWRVIRGGSFRSRPKLARSAYRCGYPTWLHAHDVGFRVLLEMP